MSKSPFFIIGTQRGGTTLLRLMLDSHQHIGVPPESHFLKGLLKEWGIDQPIQKTQREAIFDCIRTTGRFETWKTTLPELAQVLDQLTYPTTLPKVIDAVFSAEVLKEDKQIWGDKTPEYITIFDQLALCFPEAKFVFLVRDGRDVVNSLWQRGWQGWSVLQRSQYWRDAVSKMLAFAVANPNRSLCLKYEDLVLETEKSLHRITHFLKVPFDPEMLAFYTQAPTKITSMEQKQGIHQKMHRLPKPSDIQKWRFSNTPKQTFNSEAIMGNTLIQAGYTLTAYNPRKASHWLRAKLYKVSGNLMMFIHFIYHKMLGEKGRDFLRNSQVGTLLKKMVRTT